MVVEKLAFTKYPKICQLEAFYGVDLGNTYRNNVACKTFCHFIAQFKRQSLTNELTKVNYFSSLLNGSTDCGSVENKIFLAVYCDLNASDKKVHLYIHSKMNF